MATAELNQLANLQHVASTSCILTSDECQSLIRALEQGLKTSTSSQKKVAPAISQFQYHAPKDLLQKLSTRIKPAIDDSRFATTAFGMGGWLLSTRVGFVHSDWQIVRYEPHSKSPPQYDSGVELGPKTRSLLSLVVYLNDDFAEGGTVFHPEGEDQDDVVCNPVAGDGLLFFHYGPESVKYSPKEVKAGIKHIVQIPLLFERSSSRIAGVPLRKRDTRYLVILLGAPGSGKGTQVRLVSERLGFQMIDFGQLVRNAVRLKTTLGLAIIDYKRKKNKGKENLSADELNKLPRQKNGWLPNELCCELIREALDASHAPGFVLDGFPRMRSQAFMFEAAPYHLIQCIHLDVNEEELHERILQRRIHKPSGRTYHPTKRPPQVDNKDDLTGEMLTRRPEDTLESFAARFYDWNKDTVPLVKLYKERKQLFTVDGKQNFQTISKTISESVLLALAEQRRHWFPKSIAKFLQDYSFVDGFDNCKHTQATGYHLKPERASTRRSKLAEVFLKFGGADVRREWERLLVLQQLRRDVPKVVQAERLEDLFFLVNAYARGISAKAAAEHSLTEPRKLALVSSLAKHLHDWHETSTSTIDVHFGLDTVQVDIKKGNFASKYVDNLFSTMLNPSSDTKPSAILERVQANKDMWEKSGQAENDPDRVLVHGDYCLPNVILNVETLLPETILDVGRCAIGDRYIDLAFATWSIAYNIGHAQVWHFIEEYEECLKRPLQKEKLACFSELVPFIANPKAHI